MVCGFIWFNLTNLGYKPLDYMFICPLLTGTNLVTSIAAGLLRVYAWNIKSSATRIK